MLPVTRYLMIIEYQKLNKFEYLRHNAKVLPTEYDRVTYIFDYFCSHPIGNG